MEWIKSQGAYGQVASIAATEYSYSLWVNIPILCQVVRAMQTVFGIVNPPYAVIGTLKICAIAAAPSKVWR
jgi:hypothetical protein